MRNCDNLIETQGGSSRYLLGEILSIITHPVGFTHYLMTDPWEWYIFTYLYLIKKLRRSCRIAKYTSSSHGSVMGKFVKLEVPPPSRTCLLWSKIMYHNCAIIVNLSQGSRRFTLVGLWKQNPLTDIKWQKINTWLENRRKFIQKVDIGRIFSSQIHHDFPVLHVKFSSKARLQSQPWHRGCQKMSVGSEVYQPVRTWAKMPEMLGNEVLRHPLPPARTRGQLIDTPNLKNHLRESWRPILLRQLQLGRPSFRDYTMEI